MKLMYTSSPISDLSVCLSVIRTASYLGISEWVHNRVHHQRRAEVHVTRQYAERQVHV